MTSARPLLMNRYREDEARKLRIIAEVKRKRLPCFTVVRNRVARGLELEVVHAGKGLARAASRSSCACRSKA